MVVLSGGSEAIFLGLRSSPQSINAISVRGGLRAEVCAFIKGYEEGGSLGLERVTVENVRDKTAKICIAIANTSGARARCAAV